MALPTPNQRSTRKKAYPLPEAIAPGDWKVQSRVHEGGCVNIVGKELNVPLDLDERSEFVRTHELAHIRWSPKRVPSIPGIQPMTILAAEDGRIHRLLRYRLGNEALEGSGLTDGQRRDLNSLIDKAEEGGEGPLKLASYLTATTYTLADEAYNIARNRYDDSKSPQLHSAIYAARQASNMLDDEFESTIAAARILSALAPPSPKERFESEFDEDLGLVELAERTKGVRRERLAEGRGSTDDHSHEWGTMKVVYPPLVESLPTRLRSPKRSLHQSSGRLVRPDRAMTEPFTPFRRTKTRQGGGTVLIDMSGSMSMGSHDVDAILKVAPAATIATYCGEKRRGILTVIARNGRKVRQKHYKPEMMSGNVIDGPAVAWLAKQDMPRIWVCDGALTGVHDALASVEMHEEVLATCRKARIQNYASLSALRSAMGV